MDRVKVKQEASRIVAGVLDIPSESITEDLELASDLRIDSLALYEIVVEIEEFFNIRISNDEADDLRTVRDAIDFIVARTS